jgi:hypothetical protein
VSKRLRVYVEGLTEELFVERILRNHLLQFGVMVERPILAATSLHPSGQRGGFVNWAAVEADLRVLFMTDPSPDVRFTTMLDVYAMPAAIPGYPGLPTGARTIAEVDAIESAWAVHFGEPRFVPYLQRHEFETLVLAYPAALRAVFPQDAPALIALEQSVAAVPNVEDINDGPTTHPSARLTTAIPTYKPLKAYNGFFVLQEAGLSNVRPRCPRFDAWLARWEQWGAQA